MNTSKPVRVGLESLLTPDNCVLLLIDHQPFQFSGLRSHDTQTIINNVVGLAKAAKIFGVIADPVRHSVSPNVHNRAFQSRRIDAVYVPLLVTANQLRDFFQFASTLPLSGFSVTLPHKRRIMRYLDQIDPLNFFGYKLTTTKQNFYFLLGAFVVVITALYFANESRTGRAWRALREDPLAAEAMSIPVNRLKLMAFSFGAATAGFTGAIYGAIHTGAFPGDYDIGLLITVYAVVILGGTGSLAGVVVGAIVVNCAPEILRTPYQAGWLFYGAIVLIAARIRPWTKVTAVFVGTIVFGFVFHAVAGAIDSSWTAGSALDAG